ncbi:YraN family protein [Tenacibaculum sp. MEBiC06402]|uniref:YraN family protein n=1 Tax=unclassified Tenacibaculum TaxID=2635139 RepID=UPI003B9B39D5
MAQHNDLGNRGEELAVNYLLENDYEILCRNYRYLKAEVDIIAKKEDIIIAIEVKTRTSNYFGNPQDFINQKKIQLLTSAMDYYIQKNDLENEVRFDIVAIVGKKTFEIQHIEDAFLHF